MSLLASLRWAQDNLDIVVVFAGSAMTAIVAVWKFGGRIVALAKHATEIVQGAIAVIKFAASFNDRMDRMEETVNGRLSRIEKELLPNGGTSLRDAVDGLRRSQVLQDRSYEALLDTHDDPLFRSDRFGKCEWANRAYLRMVDKTIEDARGNGWLTFIHPEDRPAVFEEWQASAAQNRNFEMEYRLVSPQGFIKVRAEARVLRDPSGNIIGFLGSIFLKT